MQHVDRKIQAGRDSLPGREKKLKRALVCSCLCTFAEKKARQEQLVGREGKQAGRHSGRFVPVVWGFGLDFGGLDFGGLRFLLSFNLVFQVFIRSGVRP